MTPVSRGVVGPLLMSVLVAAAVTVSAYTWSWAYRYAALLSALLVGPCAIVLGGRIWRWRSQKVVVTSQHIIQHAGVALRHRSSVELVDVSATHIEQRWFERLARRGHVTLETGAGSIVLDRVRRPDALWRVIDRQRQLLERRHEQSDRADELTRALEDGLLTNEEYDRRWRHLFGPDGPRR